MSVTLSRSIGPDFSRHTRRPIIFFLLLFLTIPALLFTVVNADAAGVTLGWNACTASNVAGYKVYYGTASGNYAYYVDVGNTTSYALSGLSTGATYYIAATAYDSSGNQSTDSNEVNYTVPSGSSSSGILVHLFYKSLELLDRRQYDNGEHIRHHAERVLLDGKERCILDDDQLGRQRHRKRRSECYGRCQYVRVIEDHGFHHRRHLIHLDPGGRLRLLRGADSSAIGGAGLYHHRFRRDRRLHFAVRLRLGQCGGQQELFHYTEIRLFHHQCDG